MVGNLARVPNHTWQFSTRRRVVSHYKSNVRDQVFNLFEVLGVDKALGQGEYSDIDADTAQEMLNEISRLAEGPVAASFVEGDRNPPVFDPATHSVTLPESFRKSVRAVKEAGWDKVGLDEALGGTPLPKALLWALHEGPRGYAAAKGTGVGAARPPAGRHPGGLDVRRRRGFRPDPLPPRHR